MPRARWGVCVLVAAVLLGGCGGADESGLTAHQARDLLDRLDRARASATAGNVTGVEETLDGFRGRVARLRQAGRLDDETARALRLGAARVVRRAREDAPEPAAPAPVETTPETLPAPAPEEAKPDKGKGRKKGKKGKGGD